MSNKNNDLKHQKHIMLKNSDESFVELANKVEEVSPIGYTSGMGSENHYRNGGVAYDSYQQAVNDVAKKHNL